MKIGDTIKKDAPIEEHIEFSKTINAEGFTVEDIGDYYIVVPMPTPTAEEIADRELAEATSVEARLSAMEDALAELIGGM